MAGGQSGVRAKALIFFEGIKHLQSGLETQLPRKNIGETGRLGHDGAHQIVGKQVRCDFLLNHFPAFTTKNFHLHDRLDRTEVEFDLPALLVRTNEFLLADLCGIEQRVHQGQVGDADFTHDDRFGHGGVSGVIHPAWALRANPGDDVVTLAQTSSATKVSLSTLMLPDEHVNTALSQARDAEVASKVSIRIHKIASAKFVHQTPQHRGFPVFSSHGPIAQSSTAPQDRETMPAKRAIGKPSPGFCPRGCGKTFWLLGVSGIEMFVPSTSLTLRPRHNHGAGCAASSCVPVARASRSTSPTLSRCRALQ